MSLTEIRCSGYRAYNAPTTLPLGQITAVFGKNNSGKSTLTRLPLFIRGSLERSHSPLALEYHGTSFGASLTEIFPSSVAHAVLRYGFTTSNGHTLDVAIQEVSHALKDSTSTVKEFKWISAAERKGGIEGQGIQGAASRRSEQIEAARQQLGDIFLLPSEDRRIFPIYSNGALSDPIWRSVPQLLASDRGLLSRVSEWMHANLGVRITVESSSYGFSLIAASDSGQTNLAATGRGTQSAVFLAATAFALESGPLSGIENPKLLLVEEPESHLHPAAHGAVAELLAGISSTVQVIIETHSDNLILRLRRMVAEHTISINDLRLNYVDETHRVTSILVQADGGVSEWPAGVFEEDIEDAQAILDIQIARSET